ncbi:unnamed protein product [Allacma fusca]|uniref:Uncharacterized protein n=1 Tax=Allacma fusca TaxID=39272 RepID=A0A8J2JD95_9HEXA|nr:unnamed protein product [Allacma fusca]
MAYKGSVSKGRYQIVEDICMSVEKDEDLVEEAILHEGQLLDWNIPGIFASPSTVVRFVGNLPATLILYGGYGVVAALGAISYGAISSAVPISGGDYTYMLRFYGPLGGFIYQVAVNFFIGPVFQAKLATSIAACFLLAFIDSETYAANARGVHAGFYFGSFILTFLIILLSTTICLISTRLVNWLSQVFLALKFITVSGIVGICVYAYTKNREIFTDNFKNIDVAIVPCNRGQKNPEVTWQENVFETVSAVYIVAVSYRGWSTTNYITEEFKVPSKTLKHGTLISIPIIFITYTVLLFCYSLSLTVEQIKRSDFVPVHLFNEWIRVTQVQWIMPILIGMCLFGTLLNHTNSLSRVPFVGARRRHTPQMFTLLHLTRLTPIPSLCFQCLIALIYVPFDWKGWYKLLIIAALYLEILFSGIVVAGFIIWTFRNSLVDSYFKAQLMFYITYVLAAFGILLLPFIFADWSFQNFVCSWLKLLGIPITLIVILSIALPIYFFLVNDSRPKNKQNNCCLSSDRHAMILCTKLFPLGEENYSKNTLLLELEERKGRGDDVFTDTLSNASSETKFMLKSSTFDS